MNSLDWYMLQTINPHAINIRHNLPAGRWIHPLDSQTLLNHIPFGALIAWAYCTLRGIKQEEEKRLEDE